MRVMVLSRRTCTLMPVAAMSALRKAPPTSMVMTWRFSAAAMAATASTDEVAAVGDDRLSYNSLSC